MRETLFTYGTSRLVGDPAPGSTEAVRTRQAHTCLRLLQLGADSGQWGEPGGAPCLDTALVMGPLNPLTDRPLSRPCRWPPQ